jgi:tetratricopeptide (TPR) repeat protein
LADSRGGSVPVWVSLGDALVAHGRPDEASAVWERALRTLPRTVLVERLASIATGERHRERLRGVLRKLRSDQIRPDMVRLLSAQLYLKDGDAEQAARELEALQNAAAAPPLLHRLWAEVYRRRGQLEQAVVAYANSQGASLGCRCNVCGHSAPAWQGYCPYCGRWDSYRSEAEIGTV